MNILFIKYFFIGFIISEIPECPYSVTFPKHIIVAFMLLVSYPI